VANAVPNDLIGAIGKAPTKIGRGRWQEFAEALQDRSALKRAQAAAALPAFTKAGGDERFARALSAAKRQKTPKPAGGPIIEIKDASGRSFAEVRASERDVKVTLAKQTGSAFAQFLTLRLPELFEEFRSFEPGDGASKGS
jgi:ParB family chromosome partitioning protein